MIVFCMVLDIFLVYFHIIDVIAQLQLLCIVLQKEEILKVLFLIKLNNCIITGFLISCICTYIRNNFHINLPLLKAFDFVQGIQMLDMNKHHNAELVCNNLLPLLYYP